LTAKLHLLELPFYLLTLWWFVHAFGVVGAAYAWVLRSVLDAAVLLVMSKRFLPSGKSLVQPAALGSVVALGACLVLMVPATNFARVALLTVLLLGFVVVTWLKLLPSQERAIFLDSFRQVRSPAALGIVPKDADSVIT